VELVGVPSDWIGVGTTEVGRGIDVDEGKGTVVGAIVAGPVGVAIGGTAVGLVVGLTAMTGVDDGTKEGSDDLEQATEERIKKSRKPYTGRDLTASVQRDAEVVAVHDPQ